MDLAVAMPSPLFSEQVNDFVTGTRTLTAFYPEDNPFTTLAGVNYISGEVRALPQLTG